MIRLWNLLIYGRWELPPLPPPPAQCSHKWKIHKEIEVLAFDYWSRPRANYTVGFQFVLRCDHCGDMKTTETKYKEA